jgi:hypothetical protein
MKKSQLWIQVPLVFMSPKWMVFIDDHHMDNFSGEWWTRDFEVDN